MAFGYNNNNNNVSVIPIVNDVLGTIPKDLVRRREELEIGR